MLIGAGAGTGQGQGRVRDGKTVRYMMDVKVKCHSPIVDLETDGWTMMDGYIVSWHSTEPKTQNRHKDNTIH